MNLVAMQGEVWWLARPDDIRPVKGLSIHDVLKRLQETFNFASTPTALPERDQGFSFREGVFRRAGDSIVIKNMELYDDGVHLKVDSSTDDADVVFAELRSIMLSMGAKPVDKPLLHYHVSTIICDLINDISDIIKEFVELQGNISSSLDFAAQVGLRGLHFQADPSTLPPRAAKINPTMFRIEPRNDTPLAERRYFSIANMVTDRHFEILAMLDKKW
jgi:hypothetical protein